MFYDPFYQPLFSIGNIDFATLETCENDKFCIFDVAATRSTNIGLSTLNSSKDYDEIIQSSYPGNYIILVLSVLTGYANLWLERILYAWSTINLPSILKHFCVYCNVFLSSYKSIEILIVW